MGVYMSVEQKGVKILIENGGLDRENQKASYRSTGGRQRAGFTG